MPDVAGIAKTFDYTVPAPWVGTVAVGSMVRVDLHGRRVAGWVVELGVDPPPGVQLKPLSKVSSLGPSQEVLDLVGWASHFYAGSRTPIMRSASPDKMTPSLPAGPPRVGWSQKLDSATTAEDEAFSQPGVTLVRVSPAQDLFGFLVAAARLGDSLVVTPSQVEARVLGAQVRRAGGRVALAGRDWGLAAAGGMVIGARKAVWATTRDLAAILVLDEHDESLQEERNPTWNAREVAIERARRLGIPCVLVSPTPSLMAMEAADRIVVPDRKSERAGWPLVDVVDQRDLDPKYGRLFSHELVEAIRSSQGRVLCLLNRKGRAQMLACGSCGELVRTNDGEHLMTEIDGQLAGPGGEYRPLICNRCSGTKLKRLRLGVSRAREELEALARESVAEITAESPLDKAAKTRILIGTEALLHRVTSAEVVVFLDFDQELLAPRYRAAEQAFGLLSRAARLVGSRSSGAAGRPPGRLVIQTRTPEHRVLRAALESNPDRFLVAEREIRSATGFPPFGSLAEISGAGAAEFCEELSERPELLVLGPRPDGRYLLRADDGDVLAKALAEVKRPKERVRVAVDPTRA